MLLQILDCRRFLGLGLSQSFQRFWTIKIKCKQLLFIVIRKFPFYRRANLHFQASWYTFLGHRTGHTNILLKNRNRIQSSDGLESAKQSVLRMYIGIASRVGSWSVLFCVLWHTRKRSPSLKTFSAHSRYYTKSDLTSLGLAECSMLPRFVQKPLRGPQDSWNMTIS